MKSSAENWGKQHRIILGSNGYFLPAKPCTRADVVTFLYRYVNEL